MTQRMLAPLIAGLLAAGVALPTAAQAAGPVVSTAPGRIVFEVGDGGVVQNVDAGGAYDAVALADGSTLLFGSEALIANRLFIAKIDLRGALDRAFGDGGVTHVDGAFTSLLQILPQPDGKVLLVAATGADNRLQVTRLNADLTLDSAYGTGGIAATGLGEGCGACTTAALAPDGALVIAGTTGTLPATRWAVTRLTRAGAPDATFGTGGVATIPTPAVASGSNVAFGPGETIVTEGVVATGSGDALMLARLTRDGAADRTFAGGAAVRTPLTNGTLIAVHDDGAIVVDGQPPRPAGITALLKPGPRMLARYTAAGAPDPSFGPGGLVDLGAAIEPRQLLPGGGRSLLVTGTPAYGLAPNAGPQPGRLNVRLVTRGGGFGSAFLDSVRPRPVATILQNSFTGGRLVRRADGSYVVPGAVSVSQPTGEGEGLSLGRFSVAALTPSFTLDPAFGGTRAPQSLSVRIAPQRATTARSRHGIRIVLKASSPGLARVKIKHGSRAIAYSLLPVFTASTHTLPVELTRYGNAYLRRHRNVRLTFRAVLRDLLVAEARASGSGRLR